MIKVDCLSRCYGSFTAVDRVSFKIPQGEVVGLLGHNGAGKTTIMKMLTGYLEPSAGTITINGLDIVEKQEAVKSLIGYLPENLPLYPEMIVADYLEYVASLRGIDESTIMKAVLEAMKKTGLLEKAMQPISTLSRGFRQRVGVAQAIIHQPKVLILDEPTNGLDPTQTMHMRKLIRESSESATIILSTHIMQEVEAICDRVIMLRNGEVAVNEMLDVLGESRRIILETNAGLTELREVTDQLNGVVSVVQDGNGKGGKAFIVEMSDDMDIRQAISEISAMLLKQNFRLFSIYPERHDLESVFREVNMARGQVDVI